MTSVLMSRFFRIHTLQLLLNPLERVSAKSKAGREDLGGTSHIGGLNRKLQRQVPSVGEVGCCDPQRCQDVLGQLEVECRSCYQGAQIQR